MPVSDMVSNVSRLLTERYGELGTAAANRLQTWLSGTLPFSYPEQLEKHLDEEHVALLFDAFWQILPFGTGGRRGRVGYGPNRLNPTTIAITVQGHCDYLRNTFRDRGELTVVVANDVRVFNDLAGTYKFLGKMHPLLGVSSRSLARLACEVYAANGIVAYFTEPEVQEALLSTPELSFVIGKLNAVGGVNISASHNPPDDNGIKVYDQFGSQPVAPADQVLVEHMERASKVRQMPFAEALSRGRVRAVPGELHQEYVDDYIRLYHRTGPTAQDLPIVYTPLCGCGLRTVGDVLERLEFPLRVPPKQGPDGSFAVIPFRAPNPEVPQATEPAKRFADEQGSGIVLSSDPDADRVGLEVKLQDGSWAHCDGNQIATILAYYLMLDPQGPRRKGLVIETLVTTKILGAIVERAGGSCLIDDLLVGFKYVADVLKRLAKEGHYKDVTCTPDQLVLATEESHGVIVQPTIRDKDATPACMYLANLYQRLRREGRTLLDYYVQILDEVGAYGDGSRSIMMAGADGVFKRDKIMESLRARPLSEIAGSPVRKVVDHWDQRPESAGGFGPFKSETDKLPRNVLQYFCDSFVVAVRPSGTEPKLKFYCQVMPDQDLLKPRGVERLRAAVAKAEKLALAVYAALLARLDVKLDMAALLLPDIVDLQRKQQFQHTTLPQLREAIAGGKLKHGADCLKWLGEREEIRGMTPGADPLPALKSPLAYVAREWMAQLGRVPALTELEEWTRQ